MLIREYRRSDAADLARLFYETIHSVNRKDYFEQQLDAWAPELPDPELGHSRMSRRCTLVVEEGDELVAFAELESDGHLDMFYCRKDAVGRGVGRRLYEAIERRAIGMGLRRIFAEASITARPFFQRRGFTICEQQRVKRAGIALTNFTIEKALPPPTR
jgi:GNAT superfamily N-acetyltransferase